MGGNEVAAQTVSKRKMMWGKAALLAFGDAATYGRRTGGSPEERTPLFKQTNEFRVSTIGDSKDIR